MSRRTMGVVLLLMVIASLVTGTVPRVAAQQQRSTSTGKTDPELSDEVDRAMRRELHGTGGQLVPVEVLTVDNASVERAVNRLGGTVTGSVDGQLVQAVMPPAGVEALSASEAARYVQRPLRVNRLPPTEAAGFGGTVGEEVAQTNAGAWHDAGITGNVRVGIIDFFDLRLWNPTEHGPVPDAAHQFCPDVVDGLCTPTGQINSPNGDRHGVAVAEIVKDMAPGAELFLATTATTAETQAAIDWFVANGVHIVTRSLGAPYDGPGDGTGPLDAVVDYAAARGITWFNSGGNDAASGYGRYTEGVDASGYVDFENGPGVDTVLRIDPSQGNVVLDGIRWANDWYLPTAQVTDYSVEIWVGTSEVSRSLLAVMDDSQVGGAPPLEAVDLGVSVGLGQSLFLRIHANARYSPAVPDTVEVATFVGSIEGGRQSTPFSAAKPVVDSRNPSLLAVGAIDPANGSTGIAFYSSQGPTNDGRVKPDISAPSCVKSTIFPTGCFNGTSAASPAAAGMAALLLGRGLAAPGMPLAALTRHLVRDLGAPGPDNAYGAGEIVLPAAPVAVSSEPSTFSALAAPVRLLDTRPSSFVGPANLVGPYPQFAIVDLPILTSGVIPPTATAVAVNVTSTDAAAPFYVQALPTLGGAIGTFSTINVADSGRDPSELRCRADRAGLDLALHAHRRQHHRRRDGLLHPVGSQRGGTLRASQPPSRPRYPPEAARAGARRMDRPPTRGGRSRPRRGSGRRRGPSRRSVGARRQHHRHGTGRRRVSAGTAHRQRRRAARRTSTTRSARQPRLTPSSRSAPMAPSASSPPTPPTSSSTSWATSPTAVVPSPATGDSCRSPQIATTTAGWPRTRSMPADRPSPCHWRALRSPSRPAPRRFR